MGVPATGREVEVRGTEIWRLVDGKIVERWGVVDGGAVMEQLTGAEDASARESA